MGTYFHGSSEIQGNNGDGGLQTLILMNPAYAGYSENQSQHQQTANNFVFLNSNSAGNLPHAPPSQPQHFVGVPLQHHNSSQEQDHGFIPRVQYNLYNQQMELAAARDFTRAQQGLSLSLSSQQPGYVSFNNREIIQSQPMVTAMSSPRSRVEDVRGSGGSPSSASGVSNGVNGGVQSVLLSSKYLKAAQEVLDEVVNVGKGRKSGCESSKSDAKNMEESEVGVGGGGDVAEGSEKRSAELSTAERQEIQMKKAKLVNMLDEVEQRYRQYHHQMQIVISWFEQAAGIGAAKTYTALALQTISKQFRCLKDAILGQIRSASKSLGEEESFGGKIEGSRLKYVDNQIRQQRALQQLGMIQHNAWRPQRGLPERSVSVLRAWLFEHFLHPYPKDSDKIMLAKQTGLTRSQVSNWFINARVRLWKPMVEEMYNEEIKEHENNESEGKNSTKTTQNEDSTSKSTAPGNSPVIEIQNNNFIPKQDNNNQMNNQNIPTNSTSPTIRSMSGFNLIRQSEIENITQQSPKKPRNADYLLHSPNGMQSMNMDLKPNNSENVNMLKFGNDRENRDGFTLMGAPTNFIGGFGSYPIAELGRFGAEQFQAPYSGNGVSLTLGLPHCENLSLSGPHQNFMPGQLGRGVEMGDANDFNGMNTPTSAHSNNVFENINLQNPKRFAAQLLPDFVA